MNNESIIKNLYKDTMKQLYTLLLINSKNIKIEKITKEDLIKIGNFKNYYISYFPEENINFLDINLVNKIKELTGLK